MPYSGGMNDKKTPKKRPAPFSIRFTEEERARLEYDAEGMAIGEYIKWRVFHESNPRRKVRNRRPIKDHVILARAIAMLGRSQLTQNMQVLADMARSGSLPVSNQTKAQIFQATEDIKAMRQMLVEAVGKKRKKPKD